MKVNIKQFKNKAQPYSFISIAYKREGKQRRGDKKLK